MISHGPTGKLIKGHLFDVSIDGFTRAIRVIEPRLYVTWNPTKLRGWGCWEIRIKPRHKTAVYKGTHQGTNIYQLEYQEQKSLHHVLDCAFLNYDVVRKLKEMDTYNKSHWINHIDEVEAESARVHKEAAKKELQYNLSQHKTAMRDFLNMVNSGINPGRIVTAK